MHTRWGVTIVTAVVLLNVQASAAFAQSALLELPDVSQHARIMQRIGLTDITVDYHRPLVRGRKIFGGVQPYGDVWRAGANLNTTIEFTDPVTIEGHPLAKGVYGLHFIPGRSEWIAIFSNNSTSWGSFSYDRGEDALRVSVAPRAIEPQEALTYQFDNPKPDSCVVTMRWERVAIPLTVSVDTREIVPRKLRNQLRGRAQTEWQAWEEVANYLLENKLDLEEAASDAERSVSIEDRFENEMTKARALQALSRADEAKAARQKALTLGTERQAYDFARSLQRLGQQDEAMDIFRANLERHPGTWLSHLAASRIAVGAADYRRAAGELRAAADAAPKEMKEPLADLLRQVESGIDINK